MKELARPEEDIDIVVVDDERTSLTLMVSTANRLGYPVRSFSDAQQALASITEKAPHVLVTDMVMPGLTGIDLSREARRIDPDMGVILVSGVGDDRTSAGAADLGLTGWLSKPVEGPELSRALHTALVDRSIKAYRRSMVNAMYTAMAENEERIRDVTVGALEALMNILDARSAYFKGHSRAVALQAAAVAQQLGLSEDEIEVVRTAGLLHDIGMVSVPDAVVDKPGALTDEERELVRQHCWNGARILGPMKHLGDATLYVLDHHERWDGSGYPNAKSGEEISLGGQIVGISETWAGLIESRAYREGCSQDRAFEILQEHTDRWYTNEVVQALIESDMGVIG